MSTRRSFVGNRPAAGLIRGVLPSADTVFSRRSLYVAHRDLDLLLAVGSHQGNTRLTLRSRMRHAVQGSADHTSAHAIGVQNFDFIVGTLVPQFQIEALPSRGNAGIEDQGVALEAQTEDRLDAGPVKPARRAGVPGPAAASCVRLHGVNVRCRDI